MAKEYEYPGKYVDELDRVSQFVATTEHDEMVPKDFVVRWLKKIDAPDFSLEKYKNTPHAVLADLNLPLYITTNYDHLMELALLSRGREPVTDYCKYTDHLRKRDLLTNQNRKDPDYKPTESNPLVYHLHGDL